MLVIVYFFDNTVLNSRTKYFSPYFSLQCNELGNCLLQNPQPGLFLGRVGFLEQRLFDNLIMYDTLKKDLQGKMSEKLSLSPSSCRPVLDQNKSFCEGPKLLKNNYPLMKVIAKLELVQ